MTTSAFQGWNGGYISVYNMTGLELNRYTTTSSTAISVDSDMPLGRLSFGWTAPEQTVNTMGFLIKDADNNTVYSFSGSSNELSSGIFFETNNSCGGSMDCGTPENLATTDSEEGILLTWDAVENPGYGYNIYRDGQLIGNSATNFFVDDEAIASQTYRYAVPERRLTHHDA